MIEQLAIPAEYVAGLGLELIKKKISDKIDEKKLLDRLNDYISRQRKYNDICTISEEIDFQGLIEYIQNNLIDDAYGSIFAVKSKERDLARGRVVDAAVSHSKAKTKEAKRRVAKSICTCIGIIKDFYRKGISKKDYILATEIVDAIHSDTTKAVTAAADRLEEKIEDVSASVNRLKNGSIYSVERMIQDAESENLDQIEHKLTKAFDIMSVAHRLYPHYGYTWINGNIISVPKRKDATVKYPPKFVFTGTVRSGDRYFNDTSVNLADYAYRHQMTLTIHVSSAKKYLGDYEDPSQAEVRELVGKEIIAKPPEFAPAIPCSVMVKDKVYFNYILLRLQEVMDDGTFIYGNREQANNHIFFEFSVKIPKLNETATENTMTSGGEANYTIRIHDATNKEYLNYAKFMKSLHEEKLLRIHALDKDQDMFAGSVNAFHYDTGFQSAEEQIDFLERICSIEDYFHVQMTLDGEMSVEEYNTVVWVSKMISQDEVESKWSEATFTVILDHRFRKRLLELDAEIHMLSHVGNVVEKLFGAEFEFKLMRTYKCAFIQDFDKIKRKAVVLDDGDEIKITLKPGEDDTVIDTLKISDSVLNCDAQ